jgi:cytoskeletal protein RodZ
VAKKGSVFMQNARAYGARLSGLLFFLLALFIVGMLVYLTVRSAQDNQTTVTTNGPEAAQQAADEQGQVAGDAEAEQSASDDEGVVSPEAATTTAETTPATASPVASSDEAEDTNSVAAATTDDALPSTGPESVIFDAVGLAVLAGALVSLKRSQNMLQAAIRH